VRPNTIATEKKISAAVSASTVTWLVASQLPSWWLNTCCAP
jgi:hypothetical protein